MRPPRRRRRLVAPWPVLRPRWRRLGAAQAGAAGARHGRVAAEANSPAPAAAHAAPAHAASSAVAQAADAADAAPAVVDRLAGAGAATAGLPVASAPPPRLLPMLLLLLRGPLDAEGRLEAAAEEGRPCGRRQR